MLTKRNKGRPPCQAIGVAAKAVASVDKEGGDRGADSKIKATGLYNYARRERV